VTEKHVELTKNRMKFEFNKLKKVEPGLKLNRVYNEVARREGFPDWPDYKRWLEGLPE